MQKYISSARSFIMREIFTKLSKLDLAEVENKPTHYLYCPIPFDFKALRNFHGSSLQVEIYVWLGFCLPFLKEKKLIHWVNLKKQFGNQDAKIQSLHRFKNRFLKALCVVKSTYQEANLVIHDDGLIIAPSPPHVKSVTFVNKSYHQ